MPVKEYTDEMKEYRRKHYLDNREKYNLMSKEYNKTKRLELPKVCGVCFTEKTHADFGVKESGGRQYRKYLCKTCERQRFKERLHQDEDRMGKFRERVNGKNAVDRRNPEFRARFLFSDMRKADARMGLPFTLDKAYVASAILEPCAYCGRSGMKMTLDRINNARGHEHGNLNPCCFVCNYFRRDMPYEAWVKIVPALRSSVEEGLLDGWLPGPSKNFQ